MSQGDALSPCGLFAVGSWRFTMVIVRVWGADFGAKGLSPNMSKFSAASPAKAPNGRNEGTFMLSGLKNANAKRRVF